MWSGNVLFSCRLAKHSAIVNGVGYKNRAAACSSLQTASEETYCFHNLTHYTTSSYPQRPQDVHAGTFQVVPFLWSEQECSIPPGGRAACGGE